jgi:hypothetical protein
MRACLFILIVIAPFLLLWFVAMLILREQSAEGKGLR